MKVTNQTHLSAEKPAAIDTSDHGGEKIAATDDVPPAPRGMVSNRRGPQVLQSRQPRQMCFEFLRGG